MSNEQRVKSYVIFVSSLHYLPILLVKLGFRLSVFWLFKFLLPEAGRQRCSIEISVLKNFTKFTGKHLCQSTYNFIKKDTLAQMFSCELGKIFKNTLFTEHLRTTASVFLRFLVFSFFLFYVLNSMSFQKSY